jgi:hypothetical protein
VTVPLPWERLLWKDRPRRLLARGRGIRYVLTDFRIVRLAGSRADEIALHDIGEVQRTQSILDRLLGTATVRVESRRLDTAPLVLTGVRRAAQLAALVELLSGDPGARFDEEAVTAALEWEPRASAGGIREALAASAVVVIAVLAVVASLGGTPVVARSAPDDPIYPNGHKRSRDEIVRFMETDVMPWARATFGPLKGGPDRITCETCHGRTADARQWEMPAVAALPQPEVKDAGWERYSATMDAQMRNAIYGYVAEPEKQHRAGYMREVVMPGMARLLHRPSYDFTRTYAYNRSRLAFGCYHCHRVK